MNKPDTNGRSIRATRKWKSISAQRTKYAIYGSRTMPGTRNRCVDCHGSGRCSQCFGSGVNVHLNEVEPRCRPCYGTGLCDACDGTGRLSGEKLVMEMPLGLRCLISVFPVFMLLHGLYRPGAGALGRSFWRGWFLRHISLSGLEECEARGFYICQV